MLACDVNFRLGVFSLLDRCDVILSRTCLWILWARLDSRCLRVLVSVCVLSLDP